jgi:ribosomal protein S18 acetylase RimI-like enzyme
MVSVFIRQAENKDLSKILILYEGLTKDPDDRISLETARAKFEKLKTYPDYQLYVAEVENEIVGTFALLIMDNLAHRGEPSAIIEDVVIRKDLQGRGIGKEMMKKAMNLCSEKGCYKMVLSSNLSREVAHGFYESLGFRKHGYSFIVEFNSDN